METTRRPVVDAYGGVGLFAVTAAADAAEIVLVEGSPSACADARHNLRDRQATIVESAVERWAAVPADLVIADPARQGLGRDGVRALVATGCSVLVLVSCDPVSLARDAALLGAEGLVHAGSVVLDVVPAHTARRGRHEVRTPDRLTPQRQSAGAIGPERRVCGMTSPPLPMPPSSSAIADHRQCALDEAYRRHAGAVLGLAKRFVDDQAQAEEIVQEVFLRLWNDAGRYEPERGALRSFLLAHAHGRSIDLMRSEGARRRREEREARSSARPDYHLELAVLDLATTECIQAGAATPAVRRAGCDRARILRRALLSRSRDPARRTGGHREEPDPFGVAAAAG